MNQLVCIVGPTATGKTQKALELACLSPSIIVSADSRQVYRGMDIVTGKDHGDGIEIFGLDIVDPDQGISVSVWYDAVLPHLNLAWEEGKQVIVVGGTGLYVKALTDGIATMDVPINSSLRTQLEPLPVSELQVKLMALNPSKYAQLNHSDKHNPRRLIRAIEIAIDSRKGRIFAKSQKSSVGNLDTHFIGLRYCDLGHHLQKIRSRVISRLDLGAVQETSKLLEHYSEHLQSMTAIGYKSIVSHLRGDLSYEEMIESWVHDELSYAKRQLTWFKKIPNLTWYDIDNNEE